MVEIELPKNTFVKYITGTLKWIETEGTTFWVLSIFLGLSLLFVLYMYLRKCYTFCNYIKILVSPIINNFVMDNGENDRALKDTEAYEYLNEEEDRTCTRPNGFTDDENGLSINEERKNTNYVKNSFKSVGGGGGGSKKD